MCTEKCALQAPAYFIVFFRFIFERIVTSQCKQQEECVKIVRFCVSLTAEGFPNILL
jgi:hypothetical protein